MISKADIEEIIPSEIDFKNFQKVDPAGYNAFMLEVFKRKTTELIAISLDLLDKLEAPEEPTD